MCCLGRGLKGRNIPLSWKPLPWTGLAAQEWCAVSQHLCLSHHICPPMVFIDLSPFFFLSSMPQSWTYWVGGVAAFEVEASPPSCQCCCFVHKAPMGFMPVLSCQCFLCLLGQMKFGSPKPQPLLIWLSTMVGKKLWCYSLEGWCWQWKEIVGFECLSVYLFIYFCVQQLENIFIFFLVLSHPFIHHSGHQSAKLDCNNFSLSWISLGPQWNAARLGEDPWGT